MAETDDHSVTLTWTGPGSPPGIGCSSLDGYLVFVDGTPHALGSTPGGLVTTTYTSYLITGLTNGQPHNFSVETVGHWTDSAGRAHPCKTSLPDAVTATPGTPTVGENSTLITISDGHVSAGLYIAGPNAGQKTCQNGAPGESGLSSCLDDEPVGVQLTLTATIAPALPEGDTMWLVYSPPNGSDPTYQRCDPSIKTNCVLGQTGTATTLSTSISLPPSKFFGGGAHGAAASVEILNSDGWVAAPLAIELCQAGTTPRCG